MSATPLADPDAEELAAQMRALFVLPPRQRAIRRNSWLAECATEADKWRAAFAAVLSAAPDLAALDKQLRIALDPDFDLAALVGAAASPPVPVPAPGENSFLTTSAPRWSEERGGRSHNEAARQQKDEHRSGINYTVVTFVLFAILTVFRVAVNTDRGTPQPTPLPGPNYATTPTLPDFSTEEVAGFKEYEREKDAGRSTPQPQNYALWRLAGRPAGKRAVPPPSAEPPAVWNAASPPLAANQRSVYLSNVDTLNCLTYYSTLLTNDVKPEDPRPPHYDDWVKLGMPSAPGFYRLTDPNP